MILYALDTDIRTKMITWIGVASAFTATGLNLLFSPMFAAPSTMAVFGVFYYLFNKHLWKYPPFTALHGVPDLNGIWYGSLDRIDVVKDEKETKVPITITITQTWSKIDLILENTDEECCTGITRSFTKSATLNVENANAQFIRYIWEYEKANGFAELRLHDSGNTERSLEGPYYSSANIKGHIRVTQNKK
jgi:hypothetical protein